MRKKKLLIQNTALFEQLQNANLSVTRLKRELAERDAEIARLKKKLDTAEKSKTPTPLQNLEQKVTAHTSIADDFDYGAEIIGKIVVEAARLSNKLTGADACENAKELVNLILGRTEVAKSEILSIVSSNADFEAKRKAIDGQYDMAIEYFKSVMAQ